MLATIARFSAVARIGPLHMSGFPALSAVAGRLFLYLLYVVGFKNRMTRLLTRSSASPDNSGPERTAVMAGQVVAQ
jgi:NADH:ubiquinone reductase (H+-translocating)